MWLFRSGRPGVNEQSLFTESLCLLTLILISSSFVCGGGFDAWPHHPFINSFRHVAVGSHPKPASVRGSKDNSVAALTEAKILERDNCALSFGVDWEIHPQEIGIPPRNLMGTKERLKLTLAKQGVLSPWRRFTTWRTTLESRQDGGWNHTLIILLSYVYFLPYI